MQLKKASRKKVKLRIGLSGAAGFGKTYSALLMAYGITGDWTKIAVIDSEHGSAELYSNLGEYNTLTLEAPYTPERYSEAIRVCESSGMEVIIIDSITHEWDGKGGCLEIVELEAQRMKNPNTYTAWAKVTPRHNAFIASILSSCCHIITTVRRKQDYDMVKDANGKTSVIKVGMKEITREGFEYELTLNLEIVNDRHYVKASKDRTSLYMDNPEFVVGIETGKQLLNWANEGITQEEQDKLDLAMAITDMNACDSIECLQAKWKQYSKFQTTESFMKAKDELKERLALIAQPV